MAADPVCRQAAAHFMDIQIRERGSAQRLRLLRIGRHGLADDFDGIKSISALRGKDQIDTIQRLCPVDHVYVEILSSRRPRIVGRRVTNLFGCGRFIAGKAGDRQQHLGSALLPCGRRIVHSPHIQSCLAILHSLEADCHSLAALGSNKLDPAGVAGIDCLSGVFDLHRDPSVCKCQTAALSIRCSCGILCCGAHADKRFARIFFQKDSLHQSLLAPGDIHRVVVLAADPLIAGKAERQRVLVFVDLTGKALQILVVRPQVGIRKGESLFLFIAVGDSVGVISQEIADTRYLVEGCPVIQRVIQMDHPVQLPCLIQKL